MADDSFGRRIPFAFLEDLKTRFTALYTPEQVSTAIAYGMNEFSRTIAERMDFYSNNIGADKYRQVHGEIEQVKDVMVQNIGKYSMEHYYLMMLMLYIERVLERGERIDLLVDRTDQLSQAAFTFRRQSTALKRAMWWKNVKLMAMLGLVLVVCSNIFHLFMYYSHVTSFVFTWSSVPCVVFQVSYMNPMFIWLLIHMLLGWQDCRG
jgi:vesicle-associated membrane protein 7